MLYMQSYSGADGSYSLTVTFKIGTDLNFAQVLVQNRVSSALSQLPQSVQNQGVTVQKKSTAILLFVDADVAEGDLRQPVPEQLRHHQYPRRACRALPGVGNVTVFGARPVFDAGLARSEQAVCARLMPQDVIQAIQQAEPAGHRGPGRRAAGAGRAGVPIYAECQRAARRHSQFENVIVKTGNSGDVTRVRDVGWVELGAQTYSQIFSLNNKPATGIGVFQSPGANALEVEQAVKKKMEALAQGVSTDGIIRRAVRHHEIRLGIDQRGLQDADRGRSARAGRDPDLCRTGARCWCRRPQCR
jgi:HAE1 family hydrophobic/amphiphilic exporter-1